MRTVYLVAILMIAQLSYAQDVGVMLSKAVSQMEKDQQFRHAAISLYIIDGKTGKVVYEKCPELGMAPASTQKVITSVTAFELLGKEYRYKTSISGGFPIKNSTLTGDLHFIGSGDPTPGSWRWLSTKEENIFKEILEILNGNDIKKITGGIKVDDPGFDYSPVPDGWIWQDIGNYYGAGAWAFNWHENQYDLHLKAGNEPGEPTQVLFTSPVKLDNRISNFITTGKKGSGDNAYLYAAPYNENIFATGTIPAGEKDFVIAGSIPKPAKEFSEKLFKVLKANNIVVHDSTDLSSDARIIDRPAHIYGAIYSPSLDSMNYWFLKRSINLYGEAFLKTIAFEKGEQGTTSNGVRMIREFWSRNGIESSALNMADGSGLSPANRITAKALVRVLEYANDKKWFSSFYNALPEMNGIKMKDGYISGVRAYTGYINSAAGRQYTFAFIVNNFDGNAGTVREKMYKVLDLLK